MRYTDPDVAVERAVLAGERIDDDDDNDGNIPNSVRSIPSGSIRDPSADGEDELAVADLDSANRDDKDRPTLRQQSSVSKSIRDFFKNVHTFDPTSQKSATANLQEILQGIGSDDDDADMSNRGSLFFKDIIDQEFPAKEAVPNVADLVRAVFGHDRFKDSAEGAGDHADKSTVSRYTVGDWVEVEGLDMRWKLDMVTRVIQRAPDDWDWNNPNNTRDGPQWTYTYNAGMERDVNEEDLRCPERALKVVFGYRPFLWRQWAVVKLEEKLRFQEGHEEDFMEFDIQKYALDLWSQWLEHPSNVDFKEQFSDPRVGPVGRAKLLNHIMQPFVLMDVMTENSDEWNFAEDSYINIFTYTSVLGAGYALPIVVILLQIFIPILLVIVNHKEEICRIDEDKDGNPITEENYYAKCMALLVFVYYFITVIPNAYDNFFVVAGTADTVYSRLLSLRKEIWLQGDDSIGQAVGFRWDITMNTGYEVLLSFLNIYVLVRTEGAVDTILNALAFIFIADIDEEMANARWWDSDKRWITAGAVELVMQKVFSQSLIATPEKFAKQFRVAREEVVEACDGDPKLLWSPTQADADRADPNFMLTQELMSHMCSEVARKSNNRNALAQYEKQKVFFGVFESSLSMLGLSRAVFDRFTHYQTWSRWDRVLFLPSVPDLNSLFVPNDASDKANDCAASGGLSLDPTLRKLTPNNTSFENYYPEEEGLSYTMLFVRQVFRILTLRKLQDRVVHLWWRARCLRIGFEITTEFIEWLIAVTYLLFPLYLLYRLVEILFMVTTKTCDYSFLNAF